jgi:hypothetical protein
MLSEHNTISGFTLYEGAQARHPNLLILPGQELNTYEGHGNAIGVTESVAYTVGTDGYTIADAIEAFHDQGALFSINHPSFPLPSCIGCAWNFEVDPATIDAVEVQTAIVPGVDFWEELIENGSHATAVAGSDDHRAGIDEGPVRTPTGTPTTLVYARELSVNAILEGVLGGRTVVKILGPDGPMIETSMTGERVGNTVFADTAVLGAVVTGGEGLTLRVIKNGSILQEVAISSDPFEHETTVDTPAEGEDRYRHEVVEGFRRQSLSSYIWLRKADSSSGCSCRVPGSLSGDGALQFSLLFLCMWWLLRRRTPGGA